jgi:hypothetical protein
MTKLGFNTFGPNREFAMCLESKIDIYYSGLFYLMCPLLAWYIEKEIQLWTEYHF